MKRLILPTALSVFATFASADNVTVFVPREGGGVTQMEGNITPQEAALLMGESAPPEGATGVILERGKPPRWTNLPPQGVNEAFDGEGLPAIEGDEMTFDDPSGDETSGDEMTFDDPNDEGLEDMTFDDPAGPSGGGDSETSDDEMTFEDPETDPEERNSDDDTDLTFEGSRNGAKITPLAGNWVGIILDQTFDSCPPGIAEAVSAQASALDLSAVQGDISPSFDPTVSMPDFQWATYGPNQWIGDMDMTQGAAGMRVQWAMRLVNPSLINGRQQINVVGPMMGGCTIFTRFQYERIG